MAWHQAATRQGYCSTKLTQEVKEPVGFIFDLLYILLTTKFYLKFRNDTSAGLGIIYRSAVAGVVQRLVYLPSKEKMTVRFRSPAHEMVQCLYMYDFNQFIHKLEKALDHTKQELSTLRTGKATPQLLDPVQVEAYGTLMRISEVANISAPDSNLLMVTPWDKSLLAAIEKGIAAANLNLNPVVDGDIIRIVIPQLTEERRKEMVKLLHQKAEAARTMLRGLRTDTKKEIDYQEGESGISEDDIHRDLEQLDKTFQKYIDLLDEIVQAKETDLMKI